MNLEIKAKWIADLRANPDLQGQGRLRTTNERYCCLGRLCLMLSLDWIDTGYGHYKVVFENEADVAKLPFRLEETLGITRAQQSRLIAMNDTGLAFAEIADWIEENL